MSISLEEVRHVARLSRLELTEAELLSFQNKLNLLLDHFQDIEEVLADEFQERPHVVAPFRVQILDTPRPGLSREEALANSAHVKAGLFIVPTIIEE